MMGKGQSKSFISTLTGSLRPSTKEESGDPSEQVNLIRFRSGSLDSISTALSLGIGQHSQQQQQHHRKLSPTRSCSLDNLCSEQHRVEENGDERLNSSEEGPPRARARNSSQKKRTLPRDKDLTHSLPSEIQRRLMMDCRDEETNRPSREKDLDAFSDNFVVLETTTQDKKTSASQEPKLPIKSILKDPQHVKMTVEALAAANGGHPEIPSEVLEKLSADDRKMLSQYFQSICTMMADSLGNTLAQSIEEPPRVPPPHDNSRMAEASSSSLSDRTPSPSTSSIKHVRIVEDGLRFEEQASDGHHPLCSIHRESGGRTSPREERVRRRRRRERYRGERPSSLPPEYLKDTVSGGGSQETEEVAEGCEDLEIQNVVRSRSRSQDECYYYQCKTPENAKVQRRKSYSSRRKKSSRSSRTRDSIVDPSIDDNCPGVPENRVGRHRHHHHHVVCTKCFDGFKEVAVSPRSKKHKHRSQTNSEYFRELDMSHELNFGQNESYYITLHDMKNSAKMLIGSVGPGGEMKESGSRHNNQQCKKHSKAPNLQVEGPSSSTAAPHPEEESSGHDQLIDSSSKLLNNNSWHDLAFPVTSRTGRDSPHTDMAVHDLDLDSPRMMQPLELSDKNNMPLGSSAVDATVKHFYLHDHHHYHHIIHHNKP